MITRIKNLVSDFSKKLSRLSFLSFAPNEKILRVGVFLFLVFFALILPFHFAYAIPLADFIANAIFQIFFHILLLIGGYIVRLAIVLLNFVLSDHFFRYSLTGLDNPIVNVGWTLVRDLVNITFVIILVVIGLATALRFKDYQAKKALPRLIIVALLINFSYLIVGLFVDLANIVMNFFLTKVDGLNNVGLMVHSQEVLIEESLKRGAIIVGLIPVLIQVLLLVFFDELASLIILLFAGLFALRMLIIMILVILSPAAFAAAILPATQNYFNQWRSTLSQWLLLGIFAAFFLYLGNHMLIKAPDMVFAAPQTTIDYAVSDLIILLLPYGISVIFLWLGLFMGFAGAPRVAATLINTTKDYATKSRNWMEQKALGTAKTPVGMARGWAPVSRAEEAIRKRMETFPVIGRMVGGPGAYEIEKKKRIDKATKKVETIPDTPQGNEALLRIIQRPALTADDRYVRAEAIEVLAKRKHLNIKAKQAEQYFPEAQRLGANISTIYKARPDLAPFFQIRDQQTKKMRQMTVDEAMQRITPGDFWQNVQKESYTFPAPAGQLLAHGQTTLTSEQENTLNVILSAIMDERKFNEMTRKMRPDMKRQFIESFYFLEIASRTPVPRGAPGQMLFPLSGRQRAKVMDVFNRIQTDPNWQV
jgi:hypothetical protein